MLEIRLLGAPEFAYEGQAFRLHGPPRALTLLAWIVTHRRAPLARDGIAFAFWPDVDEDEARANLRRHLYAIAKALPVRSADEPWIVADKKTLGWNPRAPLLLDVDEVERLAAVGDVDAAAALYRGPFLDGFDEAWIEPERTRLQNTVEALLLRALERTRDEDAVRAIAYAERLLRVDPWREDAVRSLIELRHRSGDRAGALNAYRTFAERLRAELDVPPMLETTSLYEAIARGELDWSVARGIAARTADVAPATLPAPVSPLVGRDAVRGEIATMLEAARVVTLVGTGGVGKTRLALDAAWHAHAAFTDGVAFADLGPLDDAALVVTSIAAALGIAQATDRIEVATVIAALRQKKLLLVIDNCEHLLSEVAPVVAALVTGAPAIVVLATSREPLAVRGERVYRVPSLDVPPDQTLTPADARTYGAVALFEQRASAADPTFRLDDANCADVVEICRRLEGIALALELAAARVTMLEPRELARRLDERLRILDGGERTALPRQRTMRALIDWSWSLSTEAERTLLRRVAIFSGGWTLEAAESVCFIEPLDRTDAVILAGALVDKSLVVAESTASGRRYRLLESIREFVLEKLDDASERDPLARRHAEYFAAFASRVDVTYETMPDAPWYALAVSEIDNVRAALRWCLAADRAPLLGASLASAYARAWRFGVNRGDRQWLELAYERIDRAAHPALATRLVWQIASIALDATQHADWVAAAVRAQDDATTRALGLRWFAEAALGVGRVADAEAALFEAAEADDGRAGAKTRAATLELEAQIAGARGDVAVARERYLRAIAAAGACGAVALAAKARAGLAELEFSVGDTESAIAAARSAVTDLRATFGASIAVADVLARLAAYELARAQNETAAESAREALRIVRELDFPQRLPTLIETLAVASVRVDAPQAVRALGFAEAMRRRRGYARSTADVPGLEDMRETAVATLGDDEYARMLARGERTSEDEIVSELLRERETAVRLA